jgi:hypothetical protein
MLLGYISRVHDTFLYWRIGRKITNNTESLTIELPIKGIPTDEDDLFAELDDEYGRYEMVSITDALVHQYFAHHGVCKISSVEEFCARVNGQIERFELVYLTNGHMLTLEMIDTSDTFCYRLITNVNPIIL